MDRRITSLVCMTMETLKNESSKMRHYEGSFRSTTCRVDNSKGRCGYHLASITSHIK